MSRITLGFMGGCMVTGGHGVGGDEVFYRQLRRRLQELDGLTLSCRLAVTGNLPHHDAVAAYRAMDATKDAFASATEMIGKGVDGIVFVMRPALHWAYGKILSCDEGRLLLHPRFGFGQTPLGRAWFARGVNRAYVRLFHLSGGRVCLRRAADEMLAGLLGGLLSRCEAAGIPFIVVQINPATHGPVYARRMERLLAGMSTGGLARARWVVPALEARHFNADRYHINLEGHGEIAKALHPLVRGLASLP